MTLPATCDYYVELQVERSATLEQITTAYRRLARVHHPDRNHGNEELATTSFQRLQQAYEVLSDPVKRDRYDNSQPNASCPLYSEDGDDDEDYEFYDYDDDDDDDDDDAWNDIFGQRFSTGYSRYCNLDEWEREMERREKAAAEQEAEYRRRVRQAYDDRKAREEQANAQRAANRAAQRAAQDARLAEKDGRKAEEAARQKQRWEEAGAVTDDERLLACLHSDYCVKTDLRKKFKCGACAAKRGTKAFECPHCLVQLCQLCVANFSVHREKLRVAPKEASAAAGASPASMPPDCRSVTPENASDGDLEDLSAKLSRSFANVSIADEDVDNTKPCASSPHGQRSSSQTPRKQQQKFTNKDKKKGAKTKDSASGNAQENGGLPKRPLTVDDNAGMYAKKATEPGGHEGDHRSKSKAERTATSFPCPSSTTAKSKTPPTKASTHPTDPDGKMPAPNKDIGKASPKVAKDTSKDRSEKTNANNTASALKNTAFVRSLRPSQAITSMLLRPAMEAFGTVVAIQMRKRKDLATVQFADSESLYRAIVASPVTVNPQITVKVVKQQVKVAAAAAAAAATNKG